jgi:hypothetical protein
MLEGVYEIRLVNARRRLQHFSYARGFLGCNKILHHQLKRSCVDTINGCGLLKTDPVNPTHSSTIYSPWGVKRHSCVLYCEVYNRLTLAGSARSRDIPIALLSADICIIMDSTKESVSSDHAASLGQILSLTLGIAIVIWLLDLTVIYPSFRSPIRHLPTPKVS